MHTKRQVAFVESHTQCAGRHKCLDPILSQVRFKSQSNIGIDLPGVGANLVPLRTKPISCLMGLCDRERVHDPRPIELGQGLGQPGQPVGIVWKVDSRKSQRFAVERGPQDQAVVA